MEVKTSFQKSKVMDIKYGISATFNSAKDIFEAAGKVRAKGYTNWECYTHLYLSTDLMVKWDIPDPKFLALPWQGV